MTAEQYAQEVSDRVKKAGDNADWYLALLAIAMDDEKDRAKALASADAAFQRQPTMPEEADGNLTEEDADVVAI